jgi:nicotinamidase-related amidase
VEATKNADLHGNVLDKSPIALLLIDWINDFEFDDGAQLLKHALPAAHAAAQLKQQAQALHIPVIYVNDNFGRWQSDFNAQVRHCLEDGVRGEQVTQLLRPQREDYFVLKPKHSGFYSTSLDILLRYLGVKTLILSGVTTDICVLFTANDAYMRDLEVIVPSDCTAAVTQKTHEAALSQMRTILKAEVGGWESLRLYDRRPKLADEEIARVSRA